MEQTIEKEFYVAMQWFNAIASAVGKQKLAAINDCREQCPTAWRLLLVYLNPFNVFHIREKSLANDVEPEGDVFANVEALTSSLLQLSAVNNQMVARIKQTLKSINNEAVRHFAVQYLTKSAKIGVTAETVNKAIGANVIPVFGCMLANKYFDKPQSIVGKTIAVTEKLDGIRALAVVQVWPEHADIAVYSRQGKRIYGLIEVENAIREAVIAHAQDLDLYDGIVLDGELLITNRSSIPSKEQYKQTTKIVGADKNLNKTGITYNVFDVLPKRDFRIGESEQTYTNRRQVLEALFADNTSTAVNIVPIKQKFHFTEADRAFRAVVRLVEQAREAGEEGIMLNVCSAPYVCKRTNNLLKVKVFQDCDLEIIGFQQGAGKYADTLGALIVDYKGNQVGVGSGMSDEQRKEFWDHQAQYMGRVVTVQYFEETNDADGKKSIRFPVFKELREEGKEVSYE